MTNKTVKRENEELLADRELSMAMITGLLSWMLVQIVMIENTEQ